MGIFPIFLFELKSRQRKNPMIIQNDGNTA